MRVILIALVTSLLLLTACGQKGPLYLPQDQSVDNTAVKKEDKAKAEASANDQSNHMAGIDTSRACGTVLANQVLARSI